MSKNKNDNQSWRNYREINLMSHIMKLCDRIIEKLKRKSYTTKNQFAFMVGQSTINALFLVRELMEKYREKLRKLYVIFIAVEGENEILQVFICLLVHFISLNI